MEVVEKVINSPVEKLKAPDFAFELSQEAAQKNYLILSKHNFNLDEALKSQKGTPLEYGSEFRRVEVLENLFGRHPNWGRMERLLRKGSDWPMDELDTKSRHRDLHDAITFGNHKGATKKQDLLRKLCEKDVVHGYALPLPLAKMTKIPNALMAPMNIMSQNTIDEHGRIVEKDRLTHDQSYKFSSDTSVNSRIDKALLFPCMFGSCIKRLANWAVAARRKFPQARIYSSKIDFKSAYRRLHLNHKTALQTCTQLPEDELALMSLRLTFGGAPGPFEWGVISETVCDLANAILHDNDWDPKRLRADARGLVPERKSIGEDIPIAQAKVQVVEVPVDPRGLVDVYIDDLIALTVDVGDNVERMEGAPLLAVEAIARPKHREEPLPREEMEARNKLEAEAAAEEIKTILGWRFDFHRFLISLPENKFIAWSKDIKNLIARGETHAKELEKNIGRFTHLGVLMPFVHHFLSRLRELLDRSKNRRSIKINQDCKDDLDLMLFFLAMAHDGIDLNYIAYLKPSHIYRSDSCPKGLGGYNHHGKAWRFLLPPNLLYRASNNLLEHLASIITPWIDIIDGELGNGDCSLSMTDSSTSEGWTRKTNFKEADFDDPEEAAVRREVARVHAKHFLSLGIKEYSQWFPGRYNIVSDALSRDDDRNDDELTQILKSCAPSQVPENLEIRPLPSEIVSWLTSLLQRLPVKEQLREKHKRTRLGRGTDGLNGVDPLESAMMSFSTSSAEANETSYSEPSPWLCVKDDFRDRMSTPWLRAQSEIPFHLWHRPSENTTGRILLGTKMASSADFYRASSELSKMTTRTQSNRKRSQLECSVKSPSAKRLRPNEQSANSL
mmetsp:Transcript_13224/g.28024  ORF Transcript_13224/g.28024 Transcript_13224/m.28024 type:complete len:842 (+) Transcript_13224:3970-6495(+)